EARPAGGSVLLGLLRRYRVGDLSRPIAVAALGGALGALLVAVVTNGRALGLGGSVFVGLGFLGGLAVMLHCNRWASRAAVGLFERVQQGLRDELADGLAGAPLRVVERLQGLHGRLFGDLVYLTMAVTPQVSIIQHGAVVISVTLLLAVLSTKAMLIWLVAIGAIGFRLLPRIRALRQTRRALSAQGRRLHGAIEDLLAGFKQVKLDQTAAAELVAEVHRLDRVTTDGRVEAEAYKDASMSSANLLFYGIGLGIPLFAPRSTLGLAPDLAYEVVLLASLSLGSIYGLIQAIPALGQAEVTARSVVEVLDRLADAPREAPGEPGGAAQRLRFKQLDFEYEADAGRAGFRVGPLDLTLRAGELTMITGPNGSGKTTLMKMLCGLYPGHGRLMVDDQLVKKSSQAQYRGLFSVVLGEQHLFDRLYGIDAPKAQVDTLLARLGLRGAVSYDDGAFGPLKLSSGQRMRLALVVALLEDRPVCIFDEWTANQDPETTRFYHDTLLPELLAAGRMVIAVSHDDRYFDRADHRIELKAGGVMVDTRRGPTAEGSAS
ncbi:MAG: ATP-binding cassette domain-containing protein, partial [Myxococcales bacterium]|nr:ATP-binding cassette domain-containing protein [Myxococcales bacterium]